MNNVRLAAFGNSKKKKKTKLKECLLHYIKIYFDDIPVSYRPANDHYYT